MNITDAQRDVRQVFMGGFVGQLVTGALWLISAALSTWRSFDTGVLFLLIAGIFIFPLTQTGLRLMGRKTSLDKGHPMNGLAMQVAFIVPLCFPLIGAAFLHHHQWFYPACMVVVGAHYLPFVFLYGMWQFAVLTAVLVSAGVVFALYAPGHYSLPGLFTGVVLVVFAFIGRIASRQ